MFDFEKISFQKDSSPSGCQALNTAISRTIPVFALLLSALLSVGCTILTTTCQFVVCLCGATKVPCRRKAE